MRYILGPSLIAVSISAFAANDPCATEARKAAEAMTKINHPKAKINSARTRVVLLGSDDTNRETIGVTDHTYNVLVETVKNSSYYIKVEEEKIGHSKASCEVNEVKRSLDNSVG